MKKSMKKKRIIMKRRFTLSVFVGLFFLGLSFIFSHKPSPIELSVMLFGSTVYFYGFNKAINLNNFKSFFVVVGAMSVPTVIIALNNNSFPQHPTSFLKSLGIGYLFSYMLLGSIILLILTWGLRKKEL
ncbi:hypothetical protein [Priestia megaterium]|uniref:Uncharacterized protein n=1 Tax=Priestia megaterium TaxID=1404 RepID=A0A6M6E944_PRIMG|nr:hypothetical protein [Priestia megaterium]QJX80948.1 hypothetical protein FDZ14_33190 [Priestia megaterium]